jgi:hypothetical protein
MAGLVFCRLFWGWIRWGSDRPAVPVRSRDFGRFFTSRKGSEIGFFQKNLISSLSQILKISIALVLLKIGITIGFICQKKRTKNQVYKLPNLLNWVQCKRINYVVRQGIVKTCWNNEFTGILSRNSRLPIGLCRGDVGDRLSRLEDNDFFAVDDSFKELDDVGGGFDEGDVGDHGLVCAGRSWFLLYRDSRFERLRQRCWGCWGGISRSR